MAVNAFHVVEKSNQELKSKLTNVEKGKKSAEAALDNAERQAKGQRVLLHQDEDQLVVSKKPIIISLKKKLEKVEKAKDQAEKARDQAEQDGYNVGVVEIKEALKAEVLGVCRNYCLQVWNEALNEAKVETSSILRKAKSVYYPPAIQVFGPTSSRTNASPKVAEVGKASPAKALASFDNPSKVA